MRPIPIRRRWVVFLLAAVALLALGHGPLLRLLASPLVADEGEADVDYVCLQTGGVGVHGEKAFDLATAWHRAQPSGRLLFLRPWPQRVEEIGILPSFETICRRELAKRGVADSVLTPVPGRANDDWQKARLLGDWLRAHPDAEVALVCNRWASGQTRYILNATLDSELAARVRLVAPANPKFNETNWWRTRQGVKDFMYCWLSMAFARCQGEKRSGLEPWDAATYLQILQQTFGKPS